MQRQPMNVQVLIQENSAKHTGVKTMRMDQRSEWICRLWATREEIIWSNRVPVAKDFYHFSCNEKLESNPRPFQVDLLLMWLERTICGSHSIVWAQSLTNCLFQVLFYVAVWPGWPRWHGTPGQHSPHPLLLEQCLFFSYGALHNTSAHAVLFLECTVLPFALS